MHNFEGGHHEDHEGVGEFQDADLELGEVVVDLEHRREGRDDADGHEEEDPAAEPGDEAVDVEAVEDPLGAVLVVLSGRGTTL